MISAKSQLKKSYIPFEYEHAYTAFEFTESTPEFIETLYPESYHAIYPRVCYYYERLKENYGLNYYPNALQFNEIVKTIFQEIIGYQRCEALDQNSGFIPMHCCSYLKDLAAVLLIRK